MSCPSTGAACVLEAASRIDRRTAGPGGPTIAGRRPCRQPFVVELADAAPFPSLATRAGEVALSWDSLSWDSLPWDSLSWDSLSWDALLRDAAS